MANSRKKPNKDNKTKPASGAKPAGKKIPAKGSAKTSPKTTRVENTVEKPTGAKDAGGDPRPETAVSPDPQMDGLEHDTVSYESVSPKMINIENKGIGLVGFGMTVIVFILVLGGFYITWPQWSPYVADRIPLLEYKQKPDPLLQKLTDRINALEAEAGERVNFQTTIAEMESERQRLKGGVSSLLGRLGELENELGNLQQMIAATDLSSSDDEAKLSFQRISERLVQLEKSGGIVAGLTQRMNEMEAASKGGTDLAIKRAESASQRLSEAVSNIESRLNNFEESRARLMSGNQAKPGAAVVLAISQLRKTILSGQPFMQDLEAVKAVSGNDHGMKAALLVLNKHAGFGVSTVSDLQGQFHSIAGPMVSATRVSKSDDWIENATNRLRSFISVRKVDGTAPVESADEYILRAERHLKAGELEKSVKAVRELAELSIPAAKVAEPWILDAEARLSAERAVTSLHVYAISLIAATSQ
jgi:hypothetical protein